MKSGGKQKSTTTVQLDPSTQALNEITLQTMKQLAPLRSMVIDSLMDPKALSSGGVRLPSENMALAFSHLEDLANITNLKDAARENFNDVTLPGIMNQLVASGMGRSGAVSSALTKAGNALTLPLLETARVGRQNMAQALMSLENAKLAPVTGMMGTLPPFTPAPTTTTTMTMPGSGGWNWMGMINGGMQGAMAGSKAGPWGAVGGGIIGGILGGTSSQGQQQQANPNGFIG